jgi:hypothetical protein
MVEESIEFTGSFSTTQNQYRTTDTMFVISVVLA